jgi:hypothetical protein
MTTPFPGMDPYLEHPLLWPEFHLRLVVAIANQLQPQLRPHYVASVASRVYLGFPWRRFVSRRQRPRTNEDPDAPTIEEPTVLPASSEEICERRVEILDLTNEQKPVTRIELVSPSNKRSGAGRRSFLAARRQTKRSDCNLVEINLLRGGKNVLPIPVDRLRAATPFDYVVSVSRMPQHDRLEVWPWRVRDRMMQVRVPITPSVRDVVLDLQSVFERVYTDADYRLYVRYDEPCVPPLSADDQQWANERWAMYRAAHP